MKRLLSLLCVVCLLMSVLIITPVSASNAPVIMVDSAVLSPYEGGFAEVKLKVITDEEVSYQWQAGFFDSTFKPVDLDDNDYYIGTKTNHFKLKAANDLDQLDFRCKITYSGGVVYSQTFNFSFIKPTDIESATITVQKPVFCAYPDNRVLVPRNEEYSLNRVIWYSGDTLNANTIISAAEVFVEGKYNCRIYLDSTEGHRFTEETTVSINVAQNGSNTYTHNTKMKVNEIGQFYAEIPFTVTASEDIPDGILGFTGQEPGIPDGAMGKVYLGTDSMDIPFAFKIKTLPQSMGVAGYWTWGKTQITLNDENVYYANSGERVNLKDVATVPGRYFIYQRIYLMDPDNETIKNDALYYVVDVLEPTVLEDLGAEITVPVDGAIPADTATVCGEGYFVNDVYWHDVTDGKEVFMSKDDAFVEGHTYKAHIWLRTEEGYLLKTDSNGCPDIKASINGETAQVTYAVSDVATELTCEFTVPCSVVIDTTKVTGVKPPVAGEKPSFSAFVETDGIEIADVYWYDNTEDAEVLLTADSTFTEGHIYIVVVSLKTQKGYCFLWNDGYNEAQGYINEEKAIAYGSYDDDSLELGYKFAPCEATPEIPTDSTEPSTGGEDKPTDSTEPSTGGEDKPTDPTEPSTGGQDIPTDPTNPVEIGLLGDANEDGKVNIKDATLIQKSIANLTTLTETGEALADADLNTKINIKDATAIQKHIAGIETGYPIGKAKTK